jgi:phosphoglucomutase
MRPGTSGLRKKVEVWQGLDDDANKHYVENFIQSLIDTAHASNGNKMIDTYVFHGHFLDQAQQQKCLLLLFILFQHDSFCPFFLHGSVYIA